MSLSLSSRLLKQLKICEKSINIKQKQAGVPYGLTDKIFKLHFNLFRFVVHFIMPREREIERWRGGMRERMSNIFINMHYAA